MKQISKQASKWSVIASSVILVIGMAAISNADLFLGLGDSVSSYEAYDTQLRALAIEVGTLRKKIIVYEKACPDVRFEEESESSEPLYGEGHGAAVMEGEVDPPNGKFGPQ